ncbi:hypothetical protein [Chenggangzhangella methanolivorans]|uniref:Holin n=1 Tax=Chenggangzhangella methanolivorans TaxID=1437009 RepID=A0A9E6R8K9_9HYPH|nr:hypothetical protein [Chenggangzhangella methanolivorans]QZN99814.1 hypothetical protein K6K41_24645 [Chenggangzhangella methanolivorans]
MSKSVTAPKLEDVVADMATDIIKQAAAGDPITLGDAMNKARHVARKVVTDGRIAPALEPVKWWRSHAIVGALNAGAGALVAALPTLTPVIVDLASPEQVKWWNAAVTLTGVVWGVVGAAVSVGGRVNTTRPIG